MRKPKRLRAAPPVDHVYVTILLDADPLRFLRGVPVPGAEDEPDTMQRFLKDLPAIWHRSQFYVLAEWIDQRRLYGTRPILFYRIHRLFYTVKAGRLQSQLSLLAEHDLLLDSELGRLRANKKMHPTAYLEVAMPEGWADGSKFAAWNKPERCP